MIHRGKSLHAIAVLVSLSGYLRPTDMDSLLVKELIAPQLIASPTFMNWALVLHSSESGTIGKTGDRDENIILDDSVCKTFDKVFQKITTGVDKNEKLFPFTQMSFNNEIRQSVARLGLTRVGFVPYSLRHSGASGDFLDKTRTLQDVQFRGRWRSDESLKRYCKSSLAQAAAAEVPTAVLQWGAMLELNFAKYLLGLQKIPPPPSAQACAAGSVGNLTPL